MRGEGGEREGKGRWQGGMINERLEFFKLSIWFSGFYWEFGMRECEKAERIWEIRWDEERQGSIDGTIGF